jgi:acetyl esterase/lipase
VAAERDRLRLSSDAFADELRAAVVEVVQVTEAGALHGFLNEPGVAAERTHEAMHRMLESRV